MRASVSTNRLLFCSTISKSSTYKVGGAEARPHAVLVACCRDSFRHSFCLLHQPKKFFENVIPYVRPFDFPHIHLFALGPRLEFSMDRIMRTYNSVETSPTVRRAIAYKIVMCLIRIKRWSPDEQIDCGSIVTVPSVNSAQSQRGL